VSGAPPRRVVIDPAADALTSGDDDLHAAKNLGIEVLTPRELLTLFGL
jgi:predicted nucleic acid-binding protein